MSRTRVVSRVGELLAAKEKLEGRRITNKEIADATGMNPTSINEWRWGDVGRFDQNMIAAWCDYLDIGPGELFVVERDTEDFSVAASIA